MNGLKRPPPPPDGYLLVGFELIVITRVSMRYYQTPNQRRTEHLTIPRRFIVPGETLEPVAVDKMIQASLSCSWDWNDRCIGQQFVAIAWFDGSLEHCRQGHERLVMRFQADQWSAWYPEEREPGERKSHPTGKKQWSRILKSQFLNESDDLVPDVGSEDDSEEPVRIPRRAG